MRLIGLQQLTDFAANSGWGLMKAMMGQILRHATATAPRGNHRLRPCNNFLRDR
jgi:hypothetical protein